MKSTPDRIPKKSTVIDMLSKLPEFTEDSQSLISKTKALHSVEKLNIVHGLMASQTAGSMWHPY